MDESTIEKAYEVWRFVKKHAYIFYLGGMLVIVFLLFYNKPLKPYFVVL